MSLRPGQFAKYSAAWLHPGTIYKGRMAAEKFLKGKMRSLTGGAVGSAVGGTLAGPPGAIAGGVIGAGAPKVWSLLRPKRLPTVDPKLLEKALVRS